MTRFKIHGPEGEEPMVNGADLLVAAPRKLSKIACACLLSGSLLAGSAHAVTPDNGSPNRRKPAGDEDLRAGLPQP
ncbi:hypothetical protein F4V91_31770 [Neorhizobium galegae]|uniref:Uncharacterized protein n=1 Tax=Neorhizobium galegae TaxID=399 RepID=A0A6A1TPU0_NEOGA|nr:hypothetical protein F4V91_31770 [Neorhizobium galegae]